MHTTLRPQSRLSRATPSIAGALLLLLATACAEQVGPDPLEASPATPGAEPLDPGVPSLAVLDTRSGAAGIVFGSAMMTNSSLSSVHTGWQLGGALSPSNILSHLSGARAKGGRVVIKLSRGKDSYVKNSDGTFSLSKWKALVGEYRNVNLRPYIDDGTILGHYLIDEPSRAQRWGGKVISQATLEEMARYSKGLWPTMSTMVRVVPSWLASSSVTYKYLDAGWTQYTVGKGDAAKWVAAEAAAAKKKGLGLVVGLNVLDGGNGSSGIKGWSSGKWAMSATEIRNYGSAMLSESHACGFFNWSYDSNYYGRTDIKSAFADMSKKAKAHAKTSCRQ